METDTYGPDGPSRIVMLANGPSITHPPPVPGGISPVRGGEVGIVRLDALCGMDTPLPPMEPSLPENSWFDPGVASAADHYISSKSAFRFRI